MTDSFFEAQVVNSPYDSPALRWELDEAKQPTDHIVEQRRPASYVMPNAQPKKQTEQQTSLVLDEGKGLSTEDQEYDTTSTINLVRQFVDNWRQSPEAGWDVTPETARLLKHWRHHQFSGL